MVCAPAPLPVSTGDGGGGVRLPSSLAVGSGCLAGKRYDRILSPSRVSSLSKVSLTSSSCCPLNLYLMF